MAPNAIDFDAIKRTMENLDPGDLLVLITVCVVCLVYFLVLVAARRADKRDAAKVSSLTIFYNSYLQPRDKAAPPYWFKKHYFLHNLHLKMFLSQRGETLLFLSTNIAAVTSHVNQQQKV